MHGTLLLQKMAFIKIINFNLMAFDILAICTDKTTNESVFRFHSYLHGNSEHKNQSPIHPFSGSKPFETERKREKKEEHEAQ